MPSIALDVRYAAHLLLRRPAFSLLAMATLAIGIGVNVVAFSAVNALLLRPLDDPGAGRLAWFFESRTSGTYGSVSLPVGVGRALGASRGQVMRLVIGEGARVVVPGIALGLVAAVGVARAFSGLLVATSPTDIPALATTVVLQAAVTLTASALPAWQASRVDRLVVLREG